MTLLRMLHTAYGFFVFTVLFILFFPLLLIPIFSPTQFKYIGIINRWWAKSMFTFTFLPYTVEYRAPLHSHKQYIFCPNHFSYLDIPTMGLNPINTIFVGKSEIEKVPLFGFMYKKLHITVNRKSLKSKAKTLMATTQAIEEGKNLVIFPEAGIVSKAPPAMGAFKDGAFRAAIEKQIAIVPVTIPYNWIILPDYTAIRLHAGRIKVIFHEPIETKGMNTEQVPILRDRVFSIIQTQLTESLKSRS